MQLIDGRQFFVKMRKSLGNKRNELSPEQIDDLTRLHGNCEDGEMRDLPHEDPVTHEQRTRPRVVSKVFANEDFGYRKVTVERPLRLNFAATEERITRIEDEKSFQNLARSKKKSGPAHDAEVSEGQARQEALRGLVRSLAGETGGEVARDREAFAEVLRSAEAADGVKLSAPERKAVLSALGERDPEAEVCRDSKGNPDRWVRRVMGAAGWIHEDAPDVEVEQLFWLAWEELGDEYQPVIIDKLMYLVGTGNFAMVTPPYACSSRFAELQSRLSREGCEVDRPST